MVSSEAGRRSELAKDERIVGRAVPMGRERRPHLPEIPELVEAWEEQVTERRSAARKLRLLIDYRWRCRHESEAAGESLIQRGEADRAAIRHAAAVLGHAEPTVAGMLNAAQFCRDELPTCWKAYCAGELDLARVRKIVTAASGIQALANLRALDAAAAEYAASQNLGRLGSWLNRYVAALDHQEFQHRCQQAQTARYVRFFHREDGVSEIEALIPTMVAARIEKRLAAVARGLDTAAPDPSEDPAQEAEQRFVGTASSGLDDSSSDNTVPAGQRLTRRDEDPRTLTQREADLFADWLVTGRIDGAPVDAQIAVMIPYDTLTGDSDAPGVSADRTWAVPADQARRLARDHKANHIWYTTTHASETLHPRSHQTEHSAEHEKPIFCEQGPFLETQDVNPDPLVPKNLLSITYQGHDPPQVLRDALAFRDGTCQAEGCTVPADRCDIDHRTPWPAGPTTADNLQHLCRRHHRMKSHRQLALPQSWTSPSA